MKKPYVIGIAGGSASGKTTLSKILEERFENKSIKVFHMDQYFKVFDDRPRAKAPIVGKVYRDDNHPNTVKFDELHTDFLESLNTDVDMVLIEGLLVLWDNIIFEKLDLKLFIDCRQDERIVRRLRRNMQNGQTFDEIASVYLDMVRYRHDEYVEPTRWKADLILNGSILSERAIEAIENFVK